jgi:hypothetical protein
METIGTQAMTPGGRKDQAAHGLQWPPDANSFRIPDHGMLMAGFKSCHPASFWLERSA